MHEIFVSILHKFPEKFPTTSEQTNISEDVSMTSEQNIPQDVPMISKGCRISCCKARNLGAILSACYLGLKRDI